MAYYLVRGRPRQDLAELRMQLDSGEIGKMQPFGEALEFSLVNARVDADNWIVWEEEDYCTPPLKMEREAVLAAYFTDIGVAAVQQGKGWERIQHLPLLWHS
jgi:hypothetical protein